MWVLKDVVVMSWNRVRVLKWIVDDCIVDWYVDGCSVGELIWWRSVYVKARGEVIDVSWIGLWVEDVRFEDYCELDWSVVWLNVCGLCDLKWVSIGYEWFGWGIELIANGVNELIWIDIGMKWLIRSRMCYGEGWNWEFDVNKCVCVRELIIVGYWLCDYCVLDVWNVGEVRSMWIVSVDECCKLYYGYDVDLIGENECEKWLIEFECEKWLKEFECEKWLKELRWVEWICIGRYVLIWWLWLSLIWE